MKNITLLSFLLFFLIFSSSAQKITRYYDIDWAETTPDKAVYYADFIKEGGLYKTTSYWVSTKVVRGRSNFPDTIMANPVGLQLLYNKKGRLEDSVFYNNDNKPAFLYHYYPNGKLAAHFYTSESKKEGVTEAWDEDGKKIKNYTLFKEAEFKGGAKGWENYLKKNVSKDFQFKDDKVTTASVKVQFVVDESGTVIKPKIYASSGYKEVDRDAIRVISESPAWNPAIAYNQPVKAFRIQPFTYNLQEEKKSKR
jgi:TonB family protein